MLSRTRIGAMAVAAAATLAVGLGTAASAASATLTLGMGPAASASPNTEARPGVTADNPYTPEEICGSKYDVQESVKLSGAKVYLLYNGSENCAVTIKTASVGTPTTTHVCLKAEGSETKCDMDKYEYYAGPVKREAAGKCVRFYGYHDDVSYTSNWVHCG